ncbi:glycoside hydrolase family 28 protein [Zunongwangia atlantica]|uniref:Glycoside hydrolase family protein n=1 Tax=Zunongwangia atlantica 22II14-10F7 TaxID=1185767 RepID=A0A1Y1SZG8_9FLAO|nr:glycosyl hydrolase family 28 protein [Zunongwangia atlantica]ORL44139.1 glycoside hydrolase family protein [Zunongwangia atlantica 22II14-10F7]
MTLRTLRQLLILSIFIIFSCKEADKKTESEKTSDPLAWIDKVGAKNVDFQDKTYWVNDFGAKNDSTSLNTEAIQKAIDECAANGGGKVSFKPGIYLSGSIFVKKGVHFNIPESAELRGSENIEDYPEIDTRVAGIEMKWPAALVNVNNQKDVLIDGAGIVNGQGKVFWDYYWDLRKEYEPKGLRWIVDYDAKRPRTILISDSENITLKELNIQKAGFWTVQVLYSKYVTVDGLTIRNNIGGHGPSTDGIDIDSSEWILVENCDIDCNDDNFCLKAGRDWDGQRVNKPTQYVVIRNSIARAGSGLFTIGSETAGDIRHVYASNIKGLGTKNGLNIKSAITRGGTVEDVHLENIEMDSVRTFVEVSMNWNPSYSYSKLPEAYDIDSVPKRWRTLLKEVEPSKGIPTFKNITLKNIDVSGAKRAINVNGLENSYITDVSMENVHIQAETAGQINYSKNWQLNNVSLKTNDTSKVKIENSPGVSIADSLYVK